MEIILHHAHAGSRVESVEGTERLAFQLLVHDTAHRGGVAGKQPMINQFVRIECAFLAEENTKKGELRDMLSQHKEADGERR